MSGEQERVVKNTDVDLLFEKLAAEYQRIETQDVPPHFVANVMRAIRVERSVESRFGVTAWRFALLSSACAAALVAFNLGSLEVLSQARFIGAVGVYEFIL